MYLLIVLSLLQGMLTSALSASDISAGMCTRKVPPSSSKAIHCSSGLQVRSSWVSCLAVSPVLRDWWRLMMQCDLSLIVLGLAFPEGTRGCRTCIKIIGYKFVFIPHYVHIYYAWILVLNRKTFSVELVLKERLTRNVWSLRSSGVKGVVMGWLKICSMLSGDDAGIVKVAVMAEMLRMHVCPDHHCQWKFEDLHQVLSVLGTGVLHLSRFGLSSLATDPTQIV